MQEVQHAARAVTSLDKPIGDSDDAVYGELFAGDDPTPDEALTVSLAQDTLREAISELPRARARGRSARYGLNGGGDPQSLDTIGKRLGLTRERVRQIERMRSSASRCNARSLRCETPPNS